MPPTIAAAVAAVVSVAVTLRWIWNKAGRTARITFERCWMLLLFKEQTDRRG